MTERRGRGGAGVSVRPISPADRAALRDAFERLSPESRYRRFFTSMSSLSERDLDYLVNVDHHDHEALIAVEPAGGRLVGVARFVRTGANEAEPAIVVADDWQGRGLATSLLEQLVSRARAEGIASFRAPVLANNATAIAVLSRLGDTLQRQVGSEVELEVMLTPQRSGRRRMLTLLNAIASGTLAPARTLLEELGPRKPPTSPLSMRNTLVAGGGGSEATEACAHFAAELAQALGASLQLVSASWPLLEASAASESELGSLAHELRQSGLEVETHIRRATPATALIDVALEQGARMIVVSAPASGSASRLLPGSPTATVSRLAPCDVLLFREAPPHEQPPAPVSSPPPA